MVEVLPGAEAWSAGDGEVGVLLVHGFTGCPLALRPLAERLVEAGYRVELPRLPGHGTRWQDLQQARARDWTREVQAAFDNLAHRTRAQVAVGLSFGGGLVLHLAQARPDALAGIVLINPWVDRLARESPLAPALPLLQWLVPAVPGVGNDIAKPGADERPYNKVPLKALVSARRLLAEVRDRLGEVRTPLLVLTSRQDHIVSTADSERILREVASERVEHVWLERSYHVATLDYDGDEIVERVLAFIPEATKAGTR